MCNVHYKRHHPNHHLMSGGYWSVMPDAWAFKHLYLSIIAYCRQRGVDIGCPDFNFVPPGFPLATFALPSPYDYDQSQTYVCWDLDSVEFHEDQGNQQQLISEQRIWFWIMNSYCIDPPCSEDVSTEPNRSGAMCINWAYGTSRSDISWPGRSDAVLPSSA